jgi:hypothetical protein
MAKGINPIIVVVLIVAAFYLVGNSQFFAISSFQTIPVESSVCTSGYLDIKEPSTVKDISNRYCDFNLNDPASRTEYDALNSEGAINGSSYSYQNVDVLLVGEKKDDGIPFNYTCFYVIDNGVEHLEIYDTEIGLTKLIVDDVTNQSLVTLLRQGKIEASTDVVHTSGFKAKSDIADFANSGDLIFNSNDKSIFFVMESTEYKELYLDVFTACNNKFEPKSSLSEFLEKYGLTSGLGLLSLILAIVIIVMIVRGRK